MTNDEEAVWRRFADLLPPAEAEEVYDCWVIAEYEAGLRTLISVLTERRIAIGAVTRVEIAVEAESLGEWPEPLGPLLREVLEAGAETGVQGGVQLIERVDREPIARAEYLLVPWIGCAACGQVLARAHVLEEWGKLSHNAEQYQILAPALGATVRTFECDQAWEAYTALAESCPGPAAPGPAAPGAAAPHTAMSDFR
ncbi:hypothetical protein [Kitasatospora sp. GAS1066B]|uniref:hypothetical protein n=1 Tax=Kitasatospora sp. GAS1066B TaxID=3156271 RepID=UPI003511F778